MLVHSHGLTLFCIMNYYKLPRHDKGWWSRGEVIYGSCGYCDIDFAFIGVAKDFVRDGFNVYSHPIIKKSVGL